MTDEFADWDEIDRNRLVLPIKGKRYSIQPLGHLDEIKIKRSSEAQDEINKLATADTPDADKIAKLQGLVLDDDAFVTLLLGPARDEMRADNVPDKAIVHAAVTAHLDATEGRPTAQAWWQRGLDPEALAAEMAAANTLLEQMASEKPKTRSRSTGAARTTKPRASTSGTRSRKATPPAKRPRRSTSGNSSRTTGA